jgi:enoyl-CoA hydratase/carnithine racemase
MTDQVLFSVLPCANGSFIGVATLNNEKSLNALTFEMNVALTQQLRKWARTPSIAMVVIRGAGERAFSAGGNIKDIYAMASKMPPDPDEPAQFFDTGYTLDLRIHQYPKPLLVWGTGIVMGGGMGIMQGARRRIVTETSQLAMPEVFIGLIPDVGGSWFLSRLPGRLGLFLAITGVSLNPHDAIRLGLADRMLPSTSYDALMEKLCSLNWSELGDNLALLDRTLAQFQNDHPVELPESKIQKYTLRLQHMMQCGGRDDVIREIVALKDDPDPWLRKASEGARFGSPTTIAVIWEIHHRLRLASLEDIFRAELGLAVNFCLRHDFIEGVRAKLIDKTGKPQWKPATLEEVTPEWVNQHFQDPWPTDHPYFLNRCR